MKWIFSVDKKWKIGLNNDLLVRIPEDLSRFKEITMGQILLMGRKTFISLKEGQPLPGRDHIVLTKDKSFSAPGVYLARSKSEALARIEKLLAEEKREVFLIGGESIARQFIDQTSEAYITHIEASFKADTSLPNLLEEGFVLIDKSPLYQGDYDYYYAHYKRKDTDMDRSWDLKKIFRTDEEFLEEVASLKKDAVKIGEFKGRLLESSSTLNKALKTREDLFRRFEKLWVYGHLNHDSDTRISRYQNYQAQLRGVQAELSSMAAYFEPEILTSSWDTIDRFIEEDKD
ncbi:MAG TPA: dihydrofolate reductase, partial [Clostridia bacterium]|nr:dihydrofolate reductase [Clostridia bacterium]